MQPWRFTNLECQTRLVDVRQTGTVYETNTRINILFC